MKMDKKKKDSDGDCEMARARNAYDKARSKRNKEEEARLANVIGNILVRRGESIPAFAWFLHDHSVSKKYLSNKHLIPSCQSLAQIYIARNHFEHALDLQNKHLVIAEETNDLVEQQRACTQLGHTYIQIASSQSGKDRKTSRSIACRYFTRARKLSQIVEKIRPAEDDVVSVVCSNDYPSGSKHVSESPEVSSRSPSSRKRGRLVLYDGKHEDIHAREKAHHSIEELKGRDNLTRHGDKPQDTPPITSKCSRKNEAANASHFGVNGLKCDTGGGHLFYYCDDECCKHIIFKVGNDYVHIEPDSCELSDKLSMEHLKLEVGCLYFLKLVKENRFRGSLPIIGNLKYRNLVLESLDILKDDMLGKRLVDVSMDGWVCKRLIKRYVDCCNKLSEPLNPKLLMKLYKLQVSEDDIVVSECELDEISAAPLYAALSLHTEIASLNLSHNLLGNETMIKLKELFRSSSSNLNPLALDLHCNSFGPTSLYQICESPGLLSRLEILDISGNPLTDGCAPYLSVILQKCKGLYRLNIERCSISSLTIQNITESLDSESELSELFIGYNRSIKGLAIVHLLDKLEMLKSFSQLQLNGIRLHKNAVDSLCKLVRAPCFSGLMIGDTQIGTEAAMQLTDSWKNKRGGLDQLDISSCLLTSNYILKLSADISLIHGIRELNLGDNPLMQEGGIALASIIINTRCFLKVVDLSKCRLGLVGIVSILEALRVNVFIEKLNLSENALHEYNASLDFVDEIGAEKHCVNDPKGNCILQLSSAIANAIHLRLLDVSNNGFSEEVGETLFDAWSTRSRCGVTQSHIEGNIVHLSVEPKQCCKIQPLCCTRFAVL